MADKEKNWHMMEWFIPISSTVSTEGMKGGKNFLIKGTAITEEVTRNNIRYIASELELAAPTFKGKKILLDHKNEVMSIVGVISNSTYNPLNKSIEFEANIMDKLIQTMINDGRISEVSIGAKVADLEKGKDGIVVAKGIEGLEISLVAVPGSKNTSIDFAQSLENSLQLKESMEGKYLEPDNVMKAEDVEFEDIKVDNTAEEYDGWLAEQYMKEAEELLEGNKMLVINLQEG